VTLPTIAAARKQVPIYSGFIKYFPLAIAAVAELSQKGNDQHNPGAALFWDRSKSGDELDALMRHLVDHAEGTLRDADEILHATKVAWRAMAHLQKTLEMLASVDTIRFALEKDYRSEAQPSPVSENAPVSPWSACGDPQCVLCKGLNYDDR
jgi:Domain of unknown function (DUF5664)